MNNLDLQLKYEETVDNFRTLDEKIRESNFSIDKQDETTLREIVIDFDAVIDELEGESKGMALLYKAHTYYWLYITSLKKVKHIFDVVSGPPAYSKEGLACSTQGVQILTETKSENLNWATNLHKQLIELNEG